MAEVGNAWSRMSFIRLARLPPSLMMTICSSRQSGWLGRMPRSRQMSAMTAPIGWRRTLAAICSGVGRCVRRALASSAEGAAACRGARGIRWGRSTSGRRVQAVGVAEEPRFERVGAVQAAGDACEDQRDIGGAEAGI